MDTTTVDDMLMNSFGMADLGNIDIEKYHKDIFPPSPKSEALSPSPQVTISSAQKAISPHVVPQHFQHSISHGYPQAPIASANVQPTTRVPVPQLPNQPIHPQSHRKVQLGPNFDRLGILNQANEIPPMTAPFFAKALQQHGGTTLGAILQAHQHALQQQMQRENFLLHQAAQHQMLHSIPMHNIYQQQQQQQRMHQMMMERRTDDQIVPNPQSQQQAEHWLHPPASHALPTKQMNIKQEEQDDDSSSGRTSTSSFQDVKTNRDKYNIFNEDPEQQNDEEEGKSSSVIAPPNKSVFVRYYPESNRSLPSFSEAFSGHIEKLKLKEEQLKQMLLRHQMQYGQIPINRMNQMHARPFGVGREQMMNLHEQEIQARLLHQQHIQRQMQQHIQHQQQQQHLKQQHEQQKQQEEKQVSQTQSQEDVVESEQPTSPRQATLPQQAIEEHQCNDSEDVCMDETDVSNTYRQENKDGDVSDEKTPSLVEESTEKNKEEDTSNISASSYSHLDFLNDVNKDTDELHDYFSKKEQTPEKKNSESATEPFLGEETKQAAKANDGINMFHGELDLNSEHGYDNLFNGNSDEYYFQAFRDNNLHLLNDLNENKMDTGEEILKLLHSPLDFLNDKFLK